MNTYLLYAIGVGEIINFVLHSFFGYYVARTIGWAPSPFQLELASRVPVFTQVRRAQPGC